MTTSTEYLAEADTLELGGPQLSPGQPALQPPLHGCGWPQAAAPLTNAHDWEDAQKMPLLGQCTKQPNDSEH